MQGAGESSTPGRAWDGPPAQAGQAADGVASGAVEVSDGAVAGEVTDGVTGARREPIATPAAPAAIGPYSQAVALDVGATRRLLFCSGQIPLDPATGELVGGSAAEQARRCLESLQAVCAAAGGSLAEAVRLTIYMTDLGDFGELNEVYGSFFPADPPARVTVQVSGLPRGALVEIDAIVALG